ncbi:MAG: hypothetical protein ACOYM0_12000 [Bacteroidales bacterium]
MKKFILLFLMISGVYPLQKIMAQIKGPEVSKLTNQIVNSRKTSNEQGAKMPKTFLIRNISEYIEVHSIYNKDIVYFTGTFTRLKNGLNYMAYAEALIPSKKITLQLQNYDYIPE